MKVLYKVGDKVRILPSADYTRIDKSKEYMVVERLTHIPKGWNEGPGYFISSYDVWITLKNCNIKQQDLELVSKLTDVLR